ncbi:MAG: type III secretion inner membrane ring lipoprotein SctJ [Planctomycetota bacterium]
MIAKKIITVGLGLLLLAATGCSKTDLYTNLSERDANEMMAILLRTGISCSKSTGEEGTWNLSVPESNFADAVATLNEQGYPRESYETLGQIFQKSGLVSSPSEEKIRLMYGLSQELGNTISRIDGVQSARVHIVLPENNPFGESVKPSSAAVAITHRPSADLQTMVPDIQELVIASIEGLEMDKVKVSLFEADNKFSASLPAPRSDSEYTEVLGVRVASESANRLWMMIASVASVMVVVAGVFGGAMLRKPVATK